MTIEPPDAIGEVDGVVNASGTFMAPHAACAAPGNATSSANAISHARVRPDHGARAEEKRTKKRRADARCSDERNDMIPDSPIAPDLFAAYAAWRFHQVGTSPRRVPGHPLHRTTSSPAPLFLPHYGPMRARHACDRAHGMLVKSS
ncbi:MAG TPA: hypothetical protein VFG18_00430 [Xanthomonadaceae bacterium]|nr:hypothetical protein [Xanthomonadaceae bacterium]